MTTDILITVALIAIAVITVVLVHMDNRIRAVKSDVEFMSKNEADYRKNQMELVNDMLSLSDRMLAKYGDLNTRVIELESRIPDPVYITKEEEKEEPIVYTNTGDEDTVI